MADPFFKDLAFAALAQTARNPTGDFLQATPRNPILGYLSDLAASSYSPERTQQMQGVAKFMSAPAISETLNRLSYSEPLTTGAGGFGGTTRIRPEALEAAMAVAPMVGPAGRAAGAGAMAAGRAGERFAERAVPQIMERGGFGSELLQGMSRGTVSPLDVYHGTPYKFDRFDASKIGTGEGAQSYGHGLYFAENPRVADEYAGKLSKPFVEFASGLPENIYEKAILEKLNSIAGTTELEARGTSVRSAFNEFMNPRMWKYDPKNPKANSYNGTVSLEGKELETAMAYKKAAERLGSPTVYDTGSLYKVDLPDEQIAKMLDWDKPLSDQPNIMEALTPENMGLTLLQPVDGGFMAYVGSNGKPIGFQVKGATPETFRQKWIDRLTEFGNAEGGAGRAVGYLGGTSTSGELAPAVSSALRQAGIPGIKYLDEGSRAAGTGTRNFVVFPGNENMLTILERNNQPVQQAMQEFEESYLQRQGLMPSIVPKVDETFAGFATPEQYAAAKFQSNMDTVRWPSAWQRAGAVTPEEILQKKGITQPPPTQRDKDLYLLESRFSGYMDASKARQFLENDMLKATKKEKDLLRKYYDASGKFIAREEVPFQQAMQEFEQGLTNFMATR